MNAFYRAGHSRGCQRKAVSQISTHHPSHPSPWPLPTPLPSKHLPPPKYTAPPPWLDQEAPPYENLSFHKVTINVPDGAGTEQSEKQRNIQRNPPLKKSRVPLKYQGIKRVKSRGRVEEVGHEKTGYNQKEVWNWLYLEEDGDLDQPPSSSSSSIDQYMDDQGPDKSGVSVQFSPTEFLSATTRLAHLDLEGFERFVGSTFDRALAGARTGRAQSSDLLETSKPDSGVEDPVPSPVEHTVLHKDGGHRDTDTYVWRDSCR